MPGLNTWRSNRIEHLATLLAEQLRQDPPADPFSPVDVLVGSRGMGRWLSHRLADQLGICAHVRFPFPAARLERLLTSLIGDAAEGPDPWADDVLWLALAEELPALLPRDDFATVRAYLGADAGPLDARAAALARELAAVFDRYHTYRPALACAWSGEDRRPEVEAGDLGWQRVLWQRLSERLAPRRHRASHTVQAIELLRRSPPGTISLEPQRLFGVSALPPLWLDLLGALALHTDVDLYLLTPSHEFWAELGRLDGSWRGRDRDELSAELLERGVDPGHPLLASMGRSQRDLQLILESRPEGYVDHGAGLFTDPTAPGPGSALATLQRDILRATHPALHEPVEPSPDDDSIQLHTCHGPTRQVEVLRDIIVGLMDDHPHLQPRDFVVMTPDITSYAPLISAVFAEGEGWPRGDRWRGSGTPRLPFFVDDLGLSSTNPVAEALLGVLDAVGGRLEFSGVFDLLSLPPVLERFGLPADELPRVQGWLQQAGVRWGADEAHRAAVGQPRDEQNTWLFGLRRLLLGSVMADSGELFAGRVLPFDAVEGGSSALLGPVADFVESLVERVNALSAARPLGEWVAEAAITVERLTACEPNEAWITRQVVESLEELTAQAAAAGSTRALTTDAFTALLRGRLERPAGHTRQQSGAITFCALVPMRSVPYRVVCLLGLDDGSFPRLSRGAAFDLTARHPRPGDRDPRDEDRALFLEALLSAREHLVVLSTGRDAHTGEDRPPAVPVGELRDVLDQTFAPPGGAAAAWTRQHPLQAFSPANFDGRAGRPWSFDPRLLRAAEVSRQPADDPTPFLSAEGPAPPALPEVELDDLIALLRNPSEHLLRRRLRLDLRDFTELAQNREAVSLDGLSRWKLRQLALDLLLEGHDMPTALPVLRARGELPLGYAAEAALRDAANTVSAALDRCAVPPGSGRPPAVPVDLWLPAGRLVGSVGNTWGTHLLDFSLGSESPRNLLRLWVRLLARRAVDPEVEHAVLVTATGTGSATSVSRIGLVAPENPLPLLDQLMQLYLDGRRRPLALTPATGMALAGAIRTLPPRPTDKDRARLLRACEKARAAWWGERDDPHHRLVWGDTTPTHDGDEPRSEFVTAALTVWGPIVDARRTDSKLRGWFAGGQP